MSYVVLVVVSIIVTMLVVDDSLEKKYRNDIEWIEAVNSVEISKLHKFYKDKILDIRKKAKEDAKKGIKDIIEGKNKRIQEDKELLKWLKERVEEYRDKGARLTIALQESKEEVERLSKLADLQRNKIKTLERKEMAIKEKISEYSEIA